MMIFLWTGPKHCGKSTAAAGLAHTARQRGFRVAGLLAPSIYRDGRLIGFEAWDLRSGARSPLAVRRDVPGDVGWFHFLEEGLTLGSRALDPAAADGASFVLVDEFGLWEFEGRGWRSAVDLLVRIGRTPLVVVVRRELAEAVRDAYASVPCKLVDALAPESIDEVLRSLRNDDSA